MHSIACPLLCAQLTALLYASQRTNAWQVARFHSNGMMFVAPFVRTEHLCGPTWRMHAAHPTYASGTAMVAACEAAQQAVAAALRWAEEAEGFRIAAYSPAAAAAAAASYANRPAPATRRSIEKTLELPIHWSAIEPPMPLMTPIAAEPTCGPSHHPPDAT